MCARKPEDTLREEYFALLPQIRLVAEELEAEIRALLVPLMRGWESHERVTVKSRIKECESAIAALRRRQELVELEQTTPSPRSLRMLNDLVGVRILAFPKLRVSAIEEAVRARFCDWIADHVPPAAGTAIPMALKYHGYCKTHCHIRAEIQLMPMLVGLYWEVEHGALYKPGDRLRGLEVSEHMKERNADLIRAMHAFEDQFETLTFAPSALRASSVSPQY
jgi:ppGpp synthetase/RelA/SpoT-type nucleotidyltranferase